MTPDREQQIRETLKVTLPQLKHRSPFAEDMQELLAELDRVRAENVELRKVYVGKCPECGYRGCIRGRKACDMKIEELREKLEIAVEALTYIQGGAGPLSNLMFYEIWERHHMMNCSKEALNKILGDK